MAEAVGMSLHCRGHGLGIFTSARTRQRLRLDSKVSMPSPVWESRVNLACFTRPHVFVGCLRAAWSWMQCAAAQGMATFSTGIGRAGSSSSVQHSRVAAMKSSLVICH